jgi:DNA relaxase NicK
VDDIIKAFEAGEIITPAKSARQTRQIKADGNTLYLGSPSSDRMFRAYNKAAEVGLEFFDWLRLELQTRKDRSKALLSALAEQENTNAVVSKAIADYCDWPDPRYQSALSDQNATIELLPRNAPNFTNGSISRLRPPLRGEKWTIQTRRLWMTCGL